MLKRLKINHWLGIYFLLSAALQGIAIWNPTLVARLFWNVEFVPNLSIGVKTGWSASSMLWFILTLLTGIGMMRVKNWSRWLGLFLTGLVPIGLLVIGLILGLRGFRAWNMAAICFILVSVFAFLVLWKSRKVEQVFGWNRKSAIVAWVALAVSCLFPIVAFGFVVWMKVTSPKTLIEQPARFVDAAGQKLEQGFVRRDVLGFRVGVPTEALVTSVSVSRDKRRKNLKVGRIALATPELDVMLIIESNALGEKMWDGFRWLGFTEPYDLHRYLLRPQWNSIFTLVQTVAIPGRDSRFREFATPEWRGIVLYSEREESFVAGYSVYDLDDPLRSAACGWMVKREAQLSQVERIMSFFEFLPVVRTTEEYLQEADTALADGRPLDAQFALAQAYLLSEEDAAVAMKLARVSAGLDVRGLVMRLTTELLKDNPDNDEAKRLHEQALKVVK